ncbi:MULTISPECIES: AraC family transcriptional regulator [unclassified Variovorax]|uniref:AraC family transcriptional regulator n=1 Tax=unclassified Variovorax TaxID=663243 RepID=UPI002577D27B|nr:MULTISPECIES: AraC family transcriptional regulator [unclassified Variovorax]MDM0088309.1 AraC family transcriptional regulator [Variovorax sp. J22G40]MDM0146382.1 AraC family transcriptional regulator [Variovorax sp. J2P1-31]
MRSLPRQREPELEHDLARSPALGYEAPAEAGWVRCLAHGYPSPLARWHCHDEYELHLITSTSGKAFVGDWIGPFQPGHLVLCGPRLPHNWISLDTPDAGVPTRDLVIQFRHDPVAEAARQIPELGEVQLLLERARHGIEFFGLSEQAERHWHQVKATHGLRRLAAFCEFLADLADCTDYRLLSSVQMKGAEGDAEVDRINAIVNRITDNVAEPIAMAEVAAELGMSESRFSRYFRRATGNSFTDFVNRVRINNACHLLMQTDHYVTDICYQVGFNNVANFNRRFLEVKGMTPSEFRRQADSRFGGAH